ncbi:hypothetical protein GALL_385400 [mine drainage metagenome]|uniref:Uncharacterized protein n=1 Tax=mine drainage metagenome TaxID=410659 RepID=A0A1J5Q7U9_9ZZZZ
MPKSVSDNVKNPGIGEMNKTHRDCIARGLVQIIDYPQSRCYQDENKPQTQARLPLQRGSEIKDEWLLHDDNLS